MTNACVTGICRNQAFNDMPLQFWKCPISSIPCDICSKVIKSYLKTEAEPVAHRVQCHQEWNNRLAYARTSLLEQI